MDGKGRDPAPTYIHELLASVVHGSENGRRRRGRDGEDLGPSEVPITLYSCIRALNPERCYRHVQMSPNTY